MSQLVKFSSNTHEEKASKRSFKPFIPSFHNLNLTYVTTYKKDILELLLGLGTPLAFVVFSLR